MRASQLSALMVGLLMSVAWLGAGSQTRGGEVMTGLPTMGEWKANIAQSTISPAYPLRDATLLVSPAGPGVKLASDTTLVSGEHQTAAETIPVDGTEVPAGVTPGVTLMAKWLGSRVLATLANRNGDVMIVSIYQVSPDGQSLTIRSWGAVEQTLVFDRVP